MHGKTCLTFYETFDNISRVLLRADNVNNFNTHYSMCHMKKEENINIVWHMRKEENVKIGNVKDFFCFIIENHIKDIHLAQL